MNESYPHAGWDPLGLTLWPAGVLAVEASRARRERIRSDARTHQLSEPSALRATDEDHPSLALCYPLITFGACTKSSFCDCKHLALSRPDGSLVFELRDEEVDEAIEDGFLTSPRHPRPRDEDWREHLIDYARHHGLIN
jgi:hypothetical protein